MLSRVPYRYLVALVTSLGLFMAVLDNTVVNVSLVQIASDLHVGLSDVQWVVTAYFLAQAAVIPIAGYLGLWFGLKRALMSFLTLFVVASLLCGLSHLLSSSISFGFLLAARIVQGIGGGALFPLAIAITFGNFEPEERASASAFVSIPVLIAPTFGPVVGGIISDSSLGWPWIFFVNVPIGVIAITLIWRIIRPMPAQGRAEASGEAAPSRATFDWPGLLGSVIGVTLIAYGFNQVGQTRPGSVSARHPAGQVNGWGEPRFWVLLIVGLAILAAWAWYELRRAQNPVVNLRLYAAGTFRLSSILTWATRAIVFGSFFLLPLYLQEYRHFSALNAGLVAGGQGVGAIIGVQSGARLYDRIGPRYLIMAGFTVLTVSLLLFSRITADMSGVVLFLFLVVRGIGFGWSNLPLQTTAFSAITGSALPRATSLYNATAQLCTTIGIAAISTIFLGYVDVHAGAVGQNGNDRQMILLSASTRALDYTFTILAIGTGLGIFLALLLPRYSVRQQRDRDARPAQNRTAEQPAVGE